MRRAADVELRGVVEERLRVELGDLFGRPVLEPGGHQHLVLAPVELVVGEVADVGDVHDLGHLAAEVFQRPAEHVGEDVGAEVPDVRVLVDGGTAGVDPDAPRFQWRELFFAAAQRVVDSHPVRS